jgi:hypothetical protein
LDHPEFAHFFVKKAITLALDRHDKEREMVSQLLSFMYDKSILPDQMENGFVAVVGALDDLVLDAPQAIEWTSQFTCRAIADDILPPSFVTDDSDWGGCSSSVIAWHTLCSTYLSDPHFSERMSRIWGGGAGLHVSDTKKVFLSSIQEYMSAQDISEIRRVLHDLAVPHYHHEFVRLAIQASFDRPESFDLLMSMLGELMATVDINKTQMLMGLKRLAAELNDQVVLDYPNAKDLFIRALQRGKCGSQPWLAESDEHMLVNLVDDSVLVHKDAARAHSLSEFKSMCRPTIMEYFDSADQSEVEIQLQQAADPGLHSVFVKMLIQMSMDRSNREREMASTLLADLSQANLVSEEQMGLGLIKLLSSTEDITLDIPDAPSMLALFLGRAMVDEVLSPSFVAHADSKLPTGSLGIDICVAVKKLLAAKHSAERFTNCWHGYSLNETSEALTNAFIDMIKEYLVSRNLNELLKCIKDVGMPHYHHELVYQSIIMVLDKASAGEEVFELLAKLFMCGEINVTQTTIAYNRLCEDAQDLELDYRGASNLIQVAGSIFGMFGMIEDE